MLPVLISLVIWGVFASLAVSNCSTLVVSMSLTVCVQASFLRDLDQHFQTIFAGNTMAYDPQTVSPPFYLRYLIAE